jgi:hypothetical protein
VRIFVRMMRIGGDIGVDIGMEIDVVIVWILQWILVCTWAFYKHIDSEFVGIIEFFLELFCEFWCGHWCGFAVKWIIFEIFNK